MLLDCTTRSPTSLVDLPLELLTAICIFVDCRTIVWCRSVCRRLCDVIDASLELQYRIELVRDGMTDKGVSVASSQTQDTAAEPRTPANPLTTSDRLARLRQLREGWTTLNWTRCVTVPMPGPCCAYELVGGMFCKTQPRRGHTPELEWGFTLGHAHGHEDGHWEDVMGGPEEVGSRTMSVTWLPGRLGLGGEDDRGRTVVRDDLGIPTRDFAMDPSQDLMVLFKGGAGDTGLPIVNVYPGMIELHVRTISGNQTHPEARVPVLYSPMSYHITSVFVQIADDVVGIMYCADPSQPRIMIWNWKTGNLVVDRGDGSLPPNTWDFAFITNRGLLFTTTNDGGTLELYTFTCDGAEADPRSTQGHISVPPASRPTSSLTHVATLSLPAVHTATVRVIDVGTHAGPYLAGCPPDKPFVASNEDRIHVLTTQYVHIPTPAGPRTRLRTCVFVHNRVLAGYLKRANEVRTRFVGTLKVAWSDWGQRHARILAYPGMFQWLRYVHGQRVALLHPSSDAGKNTIQVLDFNVRAFREAVGEGRTRSTNDDADLSRCSTVTEIVDYPTHIHMLNIFTDVVESGLPYRDVRRDVCGEYSGVMIDDERLVGLKQYSVFLMGDLKEIDVFTM